MLAGWPCNNASGNNRATGENGRTGLSGPQTRLFFPAVNIIKNIRAAAAATAAAVPAPSRRSMSPADDEPDAVEYTGTRYASDVGDAAAAHGVQKTLHDCWGRGNAAPAAPSTPRSSNELRHKRKSSSGGQGMGGGGQPKKAKKPRYGKQGSNLGWT
eukprot:SAG22_NODE_1339_length_4692_cov_4.252341_3_plen_157_part_00